MGLGNGMGRILSSFGNPRITLHFPGVFGGYYFRLRPSASFIAPFCAGQTVQHSCTTARMRRLLTVALLALPVYVHSFSPQQDRRTTVERPREGRGATVAHPIGSTCTPASFDNPEPAVRACLSGRRWPDPRDFLAV